MLPFGSCRYFLGYAQHLHNPQAILKLNETDEILHVANTVKGNDRFR
jgi:hypothetical protein